LVNTNEQNKQQFTNLFPSAHTSYKISEATSLQAGYSRRIYRPRLWDLNPFFNIRNNFNIRVGNPNLQPEFTDSYEIGTIFIFKNVSLNINGYHRFTTEKIERVSTFEDNINTYRPENIGINKATGLELNFKYAPFNKFTFNGDMNYSKFKRDGVFSDQVFDFSADKWSGKLTGKYKINKDLDVELTGQHESREQTVQGILTANTYMDAGLKFKILQGRGVFNMSVRDAFASRVREDTIDNDDFYIHHRSQRGRFITFGFSYGFGKGEAMQYSGARRR
jgi:outer membrane receptor protein involved in Fe transport